MKVLLLTKALVFSSTAFWRTSCGNITFPFLKLTLHGKNFFFDLKKYVVQRIRVAGSKYYDNPTPVKNVWRGVPRDQPQPRNEAVLVTHGLP